MVRRGLAEEYREDRDVIKGIDYTGNDASQLLVDARSAVFTALDSVESGAKNIEGDQATLVSERETLRNEHLGLRETNMDSEISDLFTGSRSEIAPILVSEPIDIVEKQVVIDRQQHTLAERLIESERHAALLYEEVEEMKQLANDPLTADQSQQKALEIRDKILNGLNNLGITKENTDIRLGGTMLMGTEADVAITLFVNLNSDGSGNENIVAETVSECYKQYTGLVSLVGQRSAGFLMN